MALRAVLFDMGDTLITGFGDGQASDVCRQLAEEHPRHQALLRATAILLTRERKQYLDTLEQRSFDEAYFALCRETVASGQMHEAKRLFDVVFRRLTAHAAVYPETREVLEALHGRVKLGIVSNVGFLPYRYQHLLIQKQVFWYFDTALFSSGYRVRKPNPSIFRNALLRLGVTPEEALHVGDKLDRDVAGAHRAGIRAVWVNREWRKREPHEERPDWTVRNLRGVVRIVDQLSQ